MIKAAEKDQLRTLKEMRLDEKKSLEAKLREACEQYAVEKYTKEVIVKWSNENKGLWYLPVLKDDGTIDKLSIMKPVNRHIMGYASTKLEDDGLYSFLEQGMRECLLNEDDEGTFILTDEEAFLSASMTFNKMLKGRKTELLKR